MGDLAESNRYRLAGWAGGGVRAEVDLEIALLKTAAIRRDTASLADQHTALREHARQIVFHWIKPFRLGPIGACHSAGHHEISVEVGGEMALVSGKGAALALAAVAHVRIAE